MDIVDAAGEEHRLHRRPEFEKALARTPRRSACRTYAEGNPEGYLFPATYEFGPEVKPADMLRDMVVRWEQAATDNDLVAKRRGARLHAARDHDDRQPDRGRGPRRLHAEDRPGHLQPAGDDPDNGVTGLLQIDATVNYALGRTGSRRLDPGGHRLGRGLALQHLHAAGAAAGPDRGARRRLDPGRAATPRTALALLRHGQPHDRRDQVHRRLRRVPRVQGRATRSTATPSPTGADRRASR